MTSVLASTFEPAEIRDELERLVLGNILGPERGEHEELPRATVVRDYYLVGMLAPKQTVVDPATLEGLAAESGDDAPGSTEPPSRPTLFPSSLGMTFAAASDAAAIRLTARWGRYERVQVEAGEGQEPRTVWRRHPAGGGVTVPLADGEFGPVAPDPEQEGVLVRGRVRRTHDGWLVTAFLVNEQEDQEQRRDEVWLFQVQLEAADPAGGAIFRRTAHNGDGDDAVDAKALDMAYRDVLEFAVGHGTGVHADPDPSHPRRAVRVTTAAVPTFEIPRTDPPTAAEVPELADVQLDMAVLAETPGDRLGAALRPLVTAYRAWITSQQARVDDSSARLEGFETVAAGALDRCERAADRVEAGIALLERDPLAAEAFRFANRAMHLQRVHTLVADRRRTSPEVPMAAALAELDRPEHHRWRPFQLAFVLLNLPSLADPRHTERGEGLAGLVDLLWFPTGGGKTEAYLGLSAFTLAIRRLQGIVGGYDGRDGVAVLMRYTLRLLTVQQFQRAAALICACERIRQEAASRGDHRWGGVPFRLGLWVGYAVTPTKSTQAAKAIEEARGAGRFSREASPVQVTFCPWCGSPVSAANDAEPDPVRRRTLVYCGDPLGRCAFTRRHAPGEGLPLVTVDHELYRLVPGMVIATADKFAQLPWQGPTRALFGRVERRCERHGYRHPDLDEALDERNRHPRRGDIPAAQTVGCLPLRPPDLVIQDELHLISGPLGSLMGLYETAVDRLCTWELDGRTVRPKVVASTATIRRADAQAHDVFWRRLEIFPPPGLDIGDSFFARQRSTATVPGRRYLGVCAPGRRIKAVEIRLYVALLGAAQRLFEEHGAIADPWMTLVGYFSALRELAGMTRLVEDDVRSRLSQTSMADRGLRRRFLRNTHELTSRISSTDIPQILDELGLRFAPDADPSDRRPIDLLLATSMISVGVDVPRLGLMVVTGQPKATAEYIQATSRVGRDPAGPGLILTVLNWARARDLSHYETFEHFHATCYRHVEALSVTPFASRALWRGLTGVLTALMRHTDATTNPNHAAQSIDPHEVGRQALSAIKARAESVTSRPEVGAEVEREIKHRLDEWLGKQQRQAVQLGFRQRKDGSTIGLLEEPGEMRWGRWTCPNSLRDVEVGVNLLLRDVGDDE